MFFDSVGNIYYEKDDTFYQINITKDNNISYDQTKLTKGAKVKTYLLNSNDNFYSTTLDQVIKTDIHDSAEGDFLDYMTMGDCVTMDLDCNEHFDFFSIPDIPVYETEEDTHALYETVIYKKNEPLIRTRNSHLPLYRLFIDIETSSIFLKPIGGSAKKIENPPEEFLEQLRNCV